MRSIHVCITACLFWQFIAYAIVQLLKQFYCARKLRHKLPQFIAVCVMDLKYSAQPLPARRRNRYRVCGFRVFRSAVSPTAFKNVKLGCRREAARCFVSLNTHGVSPCAHTVRNTKGNPCAHANDVTQHSTDVQLLCK